MWPARSNSRKALTQPAVWVRCRASKKPNRRQTDSATADRLVCPSCANRPRITSIEVSCFNVRLISFCASIRNNKQHKLFCPAISGGKGQVYPIENEQFFD